MKKNQRTPVKVLRKQSSIIKSKIKNPEKEPLFILLGNISTKIIKKGLKFQKVLMKTKFRNI